jgi:hypothetical protein
MIAYFGEPVAATLARAGRLADLLFANNVLAHGPELLDFVRGLALVLAPGGVLSIEVPHVLAMLEGDQFDTIYHEHVFYFSATVLNRILASVGLAVFDVQSLSSHGGSLRVLAQHAGTGRQPTTPALAAITAAEHDAGLSRPERYRALADAAARVVGGLRRFLAQTHAEAATVAAYGAAAKGTMLLNAAAVTAEEILCVADANPLKQGHRIPGCRIPIVPAEAFRTTRPDYVVVLPWNIAGEIMRATSFIGDWGGRFVIPSPKLRVENPP